MKTKKRNFFTMFLVSAFVLVPMGVYGQEETGGPPLTPLTDQMSANTPPIGQSLIAEGIFAIQLVEALNMGRVQDEARAESTLSGMGIEPQDGWIADRPAEFHPCRAL